MATTTVRAAKVKQLSPSDIAPNPHNPRRLFDEEPMLILQESIEKLGILVPITVYQEGEKRTADKPYVILDGERRWRCAIALDLPEIPAIVVEEPSDTQNILTMFHIHNLREGWQLMPTALKLEVLMKQLKVRSERKLHELTKLSIPQIRRCKVLLTYPKRYQNMMLAPQTGRMKSDFFIELQRIRGPAIDEGFPPWTKRGDVKSIRVMLDKYLSEVIDNVTDFRSLAETYRASVRVGKRAIFMKRFDAFMRDPRMAIDDLKIPGATLAKEAKEIGRSAKRLLTQLETVELDAVIAQEETVTALRNLRDKIDERLEAAYLLEVGDEESDHRRS